MIHQLHILHIIRNIIPRLPHIILTMDLLHPPPRILPHPQRTKNRRPVLLRPHMEKLPLKTRNNLQILHQIITLILRMELRLLPALRDIIHLS